MRKYYLDNLRWITVVVVVIYHVFYMYNGEGISGGLGKITDLEVQYYDVFMYIVYPWIMPLLFIVSGISAKLYLDNHTTKEFFKSRTLKLLVPSTIGLFAFQFIQGYINAHLAGDPFGGNKIPLPVAYIIYCVSGIGVLWYMQILWVFCLVLMLIRVIERGRLLKAGSKANMLAVILFALPVWGAAQILNTPMIVVYRFGFYGILFLLGYYVFSHDEVIERIKKFSLLFAILAAGLCVAFCIMYFGTVYSDVPVNRTPVFTCYAYFASLALITGMARYLDFTTPFMSAMNSRSFGLYVFHYLGITMVAFFLVKPGYLPPVAGYILSLIAAFVFGYGLFEIIKRIPGYRWAVLGIRKKKEPKTR